MPQAFSHSTAEQVVQIVDAVAVKGRVDNAFLETFCDLSPFQVTNALALAADLGLITRDSHEYVSVSVLTRFFSTPNQTQKAAVLRVVLEAFQPFLYFRERLNATGSADQAAEQTRILSDLGAHREEIKDTLISLATYAGAIVSQGGGRYTPSTVALPNQLAELSKACDDQVAAEARIRAQIGPRANAVDRADVIEPLARALLKANASLASDAVTDAAIAVESFLARLANKMGVSLVGANGINQKLDKFRPANNLPKKVVEAARYLGHVRNAADHGIDVDPEVNSVWTIQDGTGLLYVFVACSFISSCLERDAGGAFVI